MTLEQLVTYLWRDMPLTGWALIAAVIGPFVGIYIYLQGKDIMRASSFCISSKAVAGDGAVVETQSYSVSSEFDHGRRIARYGLVIIVACITVISSLNLAS